jgi:protein-S-isoprenylcysteine O-methyltransferase Ste14
VQIRKRAWVYLIVGPLPQAVGYVGGPLALARLGAKRGWRSGAPQSANLLGLVPLAAGAGMLGAAILSHYQSAPDEVSLTIVPDYLATGGAYQLTRNPMYVGGGLMQVGWTVLLGSVPVGLTTIAYLIGIDRLGIPFEERLLHRRFGELYDRYRAGVPRWL